jgi:signal peptidase I
MVAVVVFGGFLYLQAWPPIVVVMSSSMEPAIDTGAIVLMRHVEGSPRVGDVVAVPVPAEAQESGYPAEVLHRVIEVTEDGLIRTQGDNLEEPDPFAVPASAVAKRVVVVIPGAGQLVAFLFSPYGLLWIAAGVILFVIMPFFDSQNELKLAVSEYGYHLRSHTAILQSMSVASQDLAATAEQLRESLAAGSGAGAQPATRVGADRERDPEVDAILSEWLLEPEPETDYEGTVTASNATTTGEDAHRLPPAKEQPEDGPGQAGRLRRLRRGPGRQRGPANR